MKPLYQLNKQEILTQLKTTEQGLNNSAIAGLQKEFGKNVLEEKRQKSKLTVLASQFTDVMILVLVIAAAISFIAGEHTDAFVILAIIIANAWMGYSQERNAEESIRMLKKMASQNATVIREKNPSKIETSELVPGDLIVLEAGDIVPADARLVTVASLKMDEASLTGESHSTEKSTEPIDGTNLVPGDQVNMVFKGTNVSNGTAKAIVSATGMQTEIGKIAGMLEMDDPKTPLQKRLSVFSKQLAIVVIIICALVFGFGLWKGEPPFAMFLTALSLAVAALPEALPAVITIALAGGAKRMVTQKALIRQLPAVETLGSVTYICTDKTGTLTQNVMTVEKVHAEPGQEELLHTAMLMNNQIRISEDGKLLGDSTETALLQYAMERGLTKAETAKSFPLVNSIPFDSERMRMSTLHKQGDQWILFVKGAPVKILQVIAEKHKPKVPAWQEQNRKWAEEGLRVLFFAYKIFDRDP
ncbi:MAG: HAD-IC family P-type ATPase, partial [Saprospiraceae bacterium]